jgi:hypothetical protein
MLIMGCNFHTHDFYLVPFFELPLQVLFAQAFQHFNSQIQPFPVNDLTNR